MLIGWSLNAIVFAFFYAHLAPKIREDHDNSGLLFFVFVASFVPYLTFGFVVLSGVTYLFDEFRVKGPSVHNPMGGRLDDD